MFIDRPYNDNGYGDAEGNRISRLKERLGKQSSEPSSTPHNTSLYSMDLALTPASASALTLDAREEDDSYQLTVDGQRVTISRDGRTLFHTDSQGHPDINQVTNRAAASFP